MRYYNQRKKNHRNNMYNHNNNYFHQNKYDKSYNSIEKISEKI